MSLKYTCPGCGTPLGYEGLCWKCKSEQERKAALAWTPEQIKEKQRNLIQNIQRLADMKDPDIQHLCFFHGYHLTIIVMLFALQINSSIYDKEKSTNCTRISQKSRQHSRYFNS